MQFELHSQSSAPAASQPLLESSVKSFGMVPNLHAVLAESPATLEAYKTLHQLFQQTAFDKEELTVVWMTINVEHQCHYCVPAHTAIAHGMKVDPEIINALRYRTELPTKKLNALHYTTLALVRARGRLSERELSDFFATGYERRHLLEIILGISQKVISNYTNHLAETPVDTPFQKFEWR